MQATRMVADGAVEGYLAVSRNYAGLTQKEDWGSLPTAVSAIIDYALTMEPTVGLEPTTW